MRYIVNFFRFFWCTLDGIRKVLHLGLLLLIAGLVWFAAAPKIPMVPKSAALLIAPQGELVEQYSGGPLDRVIAEASGKQ